MGRRDKVVGAKAFQSVEFSAVVTLGEESAAILRERGYNVMAGDSIDLGRVAYTHKNPFKRWLGRRSVSKGFDPHTVRL